MSANKKGIKQDLANLKTDANLKSCLPKDETANWKTYAGNLKQVSFEYPPELNLAIDNQNSIWLTEFDPHGLSEGDIGIKPHFLTIDRAPENGFGKECLPNLMKTETA